MEQTFHGYKFDGDPEGMKFIEHMSQDEILTIIKGVDNRSKANVMDNRYHHLEITKSSEGIYMVSEVQVSSSSWF